MITVDDAWDFGRDAARNGPNPTNCHFSIFATPELTAAWEGGKREAQTNDSSRSVPSFGRGGGSSRPSEEKEKPITVGEAVTRARDILAEPGMTFGERSARQIIGGLLAALEVNPAYLKSVRQGEPVFILRAQDKLAPQLVREWAERAATHGCPMEKIAEANTKAVRMEAWTPRKYPD